MKALSASAYSFRSDNSVASYPDGKALFIFDGICVLCSTGVQDLIKYDKNDGFRFATIQSDFGLSFYRHYGIDKDATYLLIADGLAYTKTDGYLKTCQILGGFWKIFLVLSLVPRTWRDWIYDLVARNRYKWFGITTHCSLKKPEWRSKIIGE